MKKFAPHLERRPSLTISGFRPNCGFPVDEYSIIDSALIQMLDVVKNLWIDESYEVMTFHVHQIQQVVESSFQKKELSQSKRDAMQKQLDRMDPYISSLSEADGRVDSDAIEANEEDLEKLIKNLRTILYAEDVDVGPRHFPVRLYQPISTPLPPRSTRDPKYTYFLKGPELPTHFAKGRSESPNLRSRAYNRESPLLQSRSRSSDILGSRSSSPAPGRESPLVRGSRSRSSSTARSPALPIDTKRGLQTPPTSRLHSVARGSDRFQPHSPRGASPLQSYSPRPSSPPPPVTRDTRANVNRGMQTPPPSRLHSTKVPPATPLRRDSHLRGSIQHLPSSFQRSSTPTDTRASMQFPPGFQPSTPKGNDSGFMSPHSQSNRSILRKDSSTSVSGSERGARVTFSNEDLIHEISPRKNRRPPSMSSDDEY